MGTPTVRKALVTGAERVSAWADLLDAINVFPVADADTGRNLVLTLAPLRSLPLEKEPWTELGIRLLKGARGNSGNIAARFLADFLDLKHADDLPRCARQGRNAAWEAVADPRPGTMLTLFDALADHLAGPAVVPLQPGHLIQALATAVRRTTDQLPELRNAGVVDAGALGMFLFLEGFFTQLSGDATAFPPPTERFEGHLRLSARYRGSEAGGGHCITALIQTDADPASSRQRLSRIGSSVVISAGRRFQKIHLHAPDQEAAERELRTLGRVTEWHTEAMEAAEVRRPRQSGPIHIMTDAAGSISRETARRLGITLLSSYILMNGTALPETLISPADLYAFMRRGGRASTSQASDFERHQHYESAISRFSRVLYLCVGSVYTGNHAAAAAWKAACDPMDRLTIIDTGAASGRLAALVLATTRFAQAQQDPDAVIRFAQDAVQRCTEYVFLDRLNYLAAGGRLSRPGAFLGDLLRLKPVISPTPAGAVKAGVVRDRDAQLRFAEQKISAALAGAPLSLILLSFSDNAQWVREVAMPRMADLAPDTEIQLTPLSLTSGVHMGPGTWSVAFVGRRPSQPDDPP